MTSICRRDFLLSTAGAALFSSGHLLKSAEASPKWPDNPFLQGPFAPVHEEITIEDLKVIGKLPADLDGMYVRNGPNLQFPPKQNYHLFEGDGMLHGVRIRDGKASYRNRWVRTSAWNEEHKAGQCLYSSFLDPLDWKLVTRQILSGKNPFPNRANTALIWHHGKLLALWEGGAPHEIKIPELETVGAYDFGGRLKHAFTAHPKVDAKTGEIMFHGYSPFPPFLQYSVANREGEIVHTTPIELPRPVMMHDLAITENYTLFLDLPGVLNITGVIRGEPIFKWDPNLGARIGVLPRHASGEKIRWFEISPCYIFHVFNAFEEKNVVHLYGCRFREYPKFVDMNAPTGSGDFKEVVDSTDPIAYRWSFDLSTGQTNETSLEVDCEFPRVNDHLSGIKTRYGYGISGSSRDSSLVKIDFEKGTNERRRFGKGRLAGEGVFVPKPDAQFEDDGYLVSFVYNAAEDTSELVLVDCHEFQETVVARVIIPQRIPFGFHGMWLDDKVVG